MIAIELASIAAAAAYHKQKSVDWETAQRFLPVVEAVIASLAQSGSDDSGLADLGEALDDLRRKGLIVTIDGRHYDASLFQDKAEHTGRDGGPIKIKLDGVADDVSL